MKHENNVRVPRRPPCQCRYEHAMQVLPASTASAPAAAAASAASAAVLRAKTNLRTCDTVDLSTRML